MAYAYASRWDLGGRNLKNDYATVAVPPDRPDLRRGILSGEAIWSTFARALRGVFVASRRAADRGPRPEPEGR